MKVARKISANNFSAEILFFGGMYKIRINDCEMRDLFTTIDEAEIEINYIQSKVQKLHYRGLQSAIIRKVENGLCAPETARNDLAPYAKFLYEEYDGIYDLAEHLYKMVDLCIMPYNVMVGIMRGSESYYGEDWR